MTGTQFEVIRYNGATRALQAVHVEGAALGQQAQQRKIQGYEHAQRCEQRVRAKAGEPVA